MTKNVEVGAGSRRASRAAPLLACLAAFGPALHAAEVRPNDFLVSANGLGEAIGPDQPAVAHATASDRYLVVWENRSGVQDGVFGSLLAGDGTSLGADFRIAGPGSSRHQTCDVSRRIRLGPEPLRVPVIAGISTPSLRTPVRRAG